MTNHPQDKWKETLSLIRNNVTPQQYSTWFSPIAFEHYDEATKTLLLRAPSSFVYEYLEAHYVGLMRRALQKCFGEGIRLSYRILTDNEHQISQDIESDPVPAGFARNERARQNPQNTAANIPGNDLDPQLNPHLVFDNYIEGDSNKLPRSVGLSIAEHPNTTQFNPMFIYGPSGCGKTHLINAIGMRTKQLYAKKRVLYISARLFQVQYTDSVRNNSTNDFINFYQSIDMLIVDDVQEWTSAERTQDTFFHIFNHLFRNGKRIILASDRPPVELRGLNDRLLTRFSCGLIAELEKPNVQLCIDILHSKIRRDGLHIPADVVSYIANTANGSVRDLEGVVNSLLAYSVVYNSDINMALAERVIKRAVKVESEQLSIDNILEEVCRQFNVTSADVLGRSRKKDFVTARHVVMYLAQKHSNIPAARIGRLIGGRDHTTVLHACTQVGKKLKSDKAFTEEIMKIRQALNIK